MAERRDVTSPSKQKRNAARSRNSPINAELISLVRARAKTTAPLFFSLIIKKKKRK